MAKNKFYVVWEGRTKGVYTNWEACKRQVDGFEGAKYKSFPTEKEANSAFRKNYWEVVGTGTTTQKALAATERVLIGKPT
jgi:ribonuclease HI